MSKTSDRKNSPLFLQKFKDKKQTIDREGLLKILEMKRRQIQNSHQKINGSHKQLIKLKKDNANFENLRTQSQKSKGINQQTIFSQNKNKKETEGNTKSSNQDLKAPKHRQHSQHLSLGLKLPAIKKSLNLEHLLTKNKSQYLIPRQNIVISRLKQAEAQTEVSEVSNSLSQKFQLDRYALKHLQLLNRFQRLLIDSRLSSGQKATLNVKTQ